MVWKRESVTHSPVNTSLILVLHEKGRIQIVLDSYWKKSDHFGFGVQWCCITSWSCSWRMWEDPKFQPIFTIKNLSKISHKWRLSSKNWIRSFLEYIDKPFEVFLRSRKLSDVVVHYVLNAIAMVDSTVFTEQVSRICLGRAYWFRSSEPWCTVSAGSKINFRDFRSNI